MEDDDGCSEVVTYVVTVVCPVAGSRPRLLLMEPGVSVPCCEEGSTCSKEKCTCVGRSPVAGSRPPWPSKALLAEFLTPKACSSVMGTLSNRSCSPVPGSGLEVESPRLPVPGSAPECVPGELGSCNGAFLRRECCCCCRSCARVCIFNAIFESVKSMDS